MNPVSLSDLSDKDLASMEREIARKHIGRFPWLIVFWGFGNLVFWLSLWPLVLFFGVPLWVGFILSTVSIALSYLPSHEAQHDIIARPGSKLRWLNEAIGHLSVIPLALPFRIARLTHIEHHKHTNHERLDPDYSSRAKGPWHAIWKSIQNRQPRSKGGMNAYVPVLMRLGRRDLMFDAIIYNLGYFGALFALAWSGYAIEAALLWWLPRHLAFTYIQYYLSWAPHHPANETQRYASTRSFRALLGNLGSMGMQYHIVHHLHPRIPLYRTPRAYWEMKPILEARGARIEDL